MISKGDKSMERKFEIITVTTNEQLQDLYEDNALTIEGLLPTEKNYIAFYDWILQYSAVKDNRLYFYNVSGSSINKFCGLKEGCSYPGNYNVMCVLQRNLEIPLAFCVPKVQIGARWFRDVIDNVKRKCKSCH